MKKISPFKKNNIFPLLPIIGLFAKGQKVSAQDRSPERTIVETNIRNMIDRMGLKLRGGEPEVIAGNVLQGLLGFLAIIFFLLTIAGGILWMTAAGNEDKVNRAKRILIAAVIGITIVLLSYLITVLIFLYLTPE